MMDERQETALSSQCARMACGKMWLSTIAIVLSWLISRDMIYECVMNC